MVKIGNYEYFDDDLSGTSDLYPDEKRERFLKYLTYLGVIGFIGGAIASTVVYAKNNDNKKARDAMIVLWVIFGFVISPSLILIIYYLYGKFFNKGLTY